MLLRFNCLGSGAIRLTGDTTELSQTFQLYSSEHSRHQVEPSTNSEVGVQKGRARFRNQKIGLETVASQPRVRQWTNDATRAAWLARETPVSSLYLASTEACLARSFAQEASLWGHARSTWPCQPDPPFSRVVVEARALERVDVAFLRSSSRFLHAERYRDRIFEAWS